MRKIKINEENFKTLQAECNDFAHMCSLDMDESVQFSIEAERSRNLDQLSRTEVFSSAIGNVLNRTKYYIIVDAEDPREFVPSEEVA